MKCEKKPQTSQVQKVLWCLATAWAVRFLITCFCKLYGRGKKVKTGKCEIDNVGTAGIHTTK